MPSSVSTDTFNYQYVEQYEEQYEEHIWIFHLLNRTVPHITKISLWTEYKILMSNLFMKQDMTLQTTLFWKKNQIRNCLKYEYKQISELRFFCFPSLVIEVGKQTFQS